MLISTVANKDINIDRKDPVAHITHGASNTNNKIAGLNCVLGHSEKKRS